MERQLEIIFTEEEARRMLKTWAKSNGYQIAGINEYEGFAKWEYSDSPFYSASLMVQKSAPFYMGNIRVHIHDNGEVLVISHDY